MDLLEATGNLLNWHLWPSSADFSASYMGNSSFWGLWPLLGDKWSGGLWPTLLSFGFLSTLSGHAARPGHQVRYGLFYYSFTIQVKEPPAFLSHARWRIRWLQLDVRSDQMAVSLQNDNKRRYARLFLINTFQQEHSLLDKLLFSFYDLVSICSFALRATSPTLGLSDWNFWWLLLGRLFFHQLGDVGCDFLRNG